MATSVCYLEGNYFVCSRQWRCEDSMGKIQLKYPSHYREKQPAGKISRDLRRSLIYQPEYSVRYFPDDIKLQFVSSLFSETNSFKKWLRALRNCNNVRHWTGYVCNHSHHQLFLMSTGPLLSLDLIFLRPTAARMENNHLFCLIYLQCTQTLLMTT